MSVRSPYSRWLVLAGVVAFAAGTAVITQVGCHSKPPEPVVEQAVKNLEYKPRQPIETSGWLAVYDSRQPSWSNGSLDDYATKHKNHIATYLEYVEDLLKAGTGKDKALMTKASLLNSQGQPAAAYEALVELRASTKEAGLEAENLYTVIYYQGVTAFRMGETENCVLCRGASSCIFPISSAAVHTNTRGSRLAIEHYTEYLQQFPDDLEVKWLLNLAHMTLGDYPDKVDPHHLVRLDAFNKQEFDLGQFRDISHQAGLHRLNQSGGAIMDDFDNDGLFDIIVTDWAPDAPMAYFRNKGDGTFENRTKAAGLEKQCSGLTCFQTDYNNDGHLDIFIPRGAWLPSNLAMRPSLLRNNGNGTFTDVTQEVGLATPFTSNTASWADYDNDGHLDLFMCSQRRPCALYRNKGDGTFEDVADKVGLSGLDNVKGAAWSDFDNDGFSDLFVNMGKSIGDSGTFVGTARLYRNNRNGTFTDVTKEMGIDGPKDGFACWAFDFDNDGWIDIFATTTQHTLEDVVKGILGQPHNLETARLYRNLGGKRFEDVTKQAGLDKCYSQMGCNFGDIDNDGYLDFYLATGDPCLSTLIPNRLFKNVAGKRFSEITASSRTGHLQKGHGIAFGDWRRCGSQDIFAQLGGATLGDRYHNMLFQNPNLSNNNWLSVKLIGAQTKDGKDKKTNRAAVGARIAVYTAGENPLAVHRHVSSGSSFGANPYEQHIGLGTHTKIDRIEVLWPTTGEKQVFRDIPIGVGVVITEGSKDLQIRTWKPIPLPQE